jgi:hypothetical protein
MCSRSLSAQCAFFLNAFPSHLTQVSLLFIAPLLHLNVPISIPHPLRRLSHSAHALAALLVPGHAVLMAYGDLWLLDARSAEIVDVTPAGVADRQEMVAAAIANEPNLAVVAIGISLWHEGLLGAPQLFHLLLKGHSLLSWLALFIAGLAVKPPSSS